MKHIDPHVHPRPDIRSVAELAEEQGITAILLMPKSPTSILEEKDLVGQLADLQKKKPAVRCFFYALLTSDDSQIKEAVRLAMYYPEVVGLKLFPPENEKKKIYKTLVKLGYSGVLAVHAEKASLFKPELFDPKRPWTHNSARPPESEIESIKEQIRFAAETDFKGTLYICHITLPESAEIIWQAKKYLDIYSEVAPHHLLLSETAMKGEGGLLMKVNPPLRSRSEVKGLFEAVESGLVDCLGTDYAYHPPLAKLCPPYPSGIACYEFYGMILNLLREYGLAEKEIEKLTHWNVKKVFGGKLKDV